jgi:hypothetical protein
VLEQWDVTRFFGRAAGKQIRAMALYGSVCAGVFAEHQYDLLVFLKLNKFEAREKRSKWFKSK